MICTNCVGMPILQLRADGIRQPEDEAADGGHKGICRAEEHGGNAHEAPAADHSLHEHLDIGRGHVRSADTHKDTGDHDRLKFFPDGVKPGGKRRRTVQSRASDPQSPDGFVQQETQQKLDEKMDRWVYLNDLAEQIEAQKE